MNSKFTPSTKVFYLVQVEEKEEPIRIEFTNESIRDDEGRLGCDSYECWDEEETRYVFHIDEYGDKEMRTKTIDGDSIIFIVSEINKVEDEEDQQ